MSTPQPTSAVAPASALPVAVPPRGWSRRTRSSWSPVTPWASPAPRA